MTASDPPFLDETFPLPLDAPFTRAAACAAGLTDNQLCRLVRDGYLRRPGRSAYVPAQLPDSMELRIATLELLVPDGCFVTDHTAAWLHVGDHALPPNAHLELPRLSMFRPPEEGRLRNGLAASGERSLAPEDLMCVGQLHVTTPLRTALDLGRLQRNPDVALWGMDSMLATHTFSRDQLLAELPRFKRQRGIVRMRVLAPRADGDCQSFGEAALRNRWYDAGLPRPRLQIPIIVDGHVAFWLDMGLEELLFAAEYDGEEFHSEDEDVEFDQERRGWLETNRSWVVKDFRRPNVFGQHQDATETLRWLYRDARRTWGLRRSLRPSPPSHPLPRRR